MTPRSLFIRSAVAVALAAAAVAAGPVAGGPALAASSVKVAVNREPITSYQIQLRAAFLRLRHVKGDLQQAATDELIDEALKKQEIRRRGIQVPDAMVDEAFQKFASDNKLTPAQLSEILSRAGFSADAFKDYIRVQIGWGQAVQANMRQRDRLSDQDVVQRMLANGGEKPSTTEYTLQQVIFVIPDAEKKAKTPQRTAEANGLRQRFRGCDSTYDVAKGLLDVTVRDLGRVAQPELPPRWKDDIVKLNPGQTTPVKPTERGVEFIAVCDSRTVSDDVAAKLVFQARDLEKLGQEEPDKDFLKQLRDKARIVKK
ncbi:peptidylprolyl isomerase [Aurantimonas sp. MSK8Z-1]|uniref:peptidylprolyl isomerase n=1 Tax=Mangrovibrevibacter kandeliae TaxID=2968473 RepID=UPI0021178FA6|nr:peptidylprolyl isomerase [Aurantimonas sp. MSK8Z-1]MCW4114162.1 peptidylprolyl isomerase [Aurantimonas sp. MSK8Z-1]